MIKKYLFLLLLAVGAAALLYMNNDDGELGIDKNYQEYQHQKASKNKARFPKMEMPEMYSLIQQQKRTPNDLKMPTYKGNYLVNEYQKKGRSLKSNNITFMERGPGNIAGRTRAVLNYSEDFTFSTWLIGSASGGVWRTDDGGESWENMTPDLPNLGFNTLAHSAANEDIVYGGTGEHFTSDIDGSGMFKSMDFGESWEQIVNPDDYEDFTTISRILVDPENPDVVLATTRNSVWSRRVDEDGFLEGDLKAAIYKSIDGGLTWDRKISSTEDRYDQIIADPSDFNILYVAINGRGVIKSIDGGESWVDASQGMNPTGRVEIAISSVNTNRLFASTVGGETGTGADLYVTSNGGESWDLASVEGGTGNLDFLLQGFYDNTIAAHPYDEDIVYVGGVDLYKFTMTGDSVFSNRFVVEEDGTSGFFDLINFGGSIAGGGIDLGEDLSIAEINPVELRFGQGGQIAHRFTVDGRGAGVPAADYQYEDIVEIPFQVWDTGEDRQLMVSFRDQQNDGVWNLIEAFTGEPTSDNSREYIYIHDVDYADTANVDIAVDGGHEFRNMFFIWPVLTDSSEFADNVFPTSNYRINKVTVNAQEKDIAVMSDARGQFDGINNQPQTSRTAEGIHPDHHNIFILNDNPARQQFRLLVANDGGMYVSRRSRDPGVLDGAFSYASFGNNTTQFYSADKAPGVDRYIGGMQDNGSWFTPAGTTSSASSAFQFAAFGDGFEALWNNRDINLILAGSQFNGIVRSTNQGASFVTSTDGLGGDGPFITRMANSKNLPDRVFAIGASGVYRSNNFGASWESIPIDNPLWSFSNSGDIEVSLADFEVIWAGGFLEEDARIFVSTDGGESFTPTNYYQDEILGFMSGLATHPTERESAYAIFSFQGRPKILKTEDLGQSWVDITGFDDSTDGKSTKGFPDVAVNKVFVFPNDTDRIWAGTEIGIVESLDGGASWTIMDNEMGAINVADMILQDDQITIATYGRGIWTATVEGIEQDIIFPPVISGSSVAPNGDLKLAVEYSEIFDSSIVILNGDTLSQIGMNQEGLQNFLFDNPQINGNGEFRVIGYLDGQAYPSIKFNVALFIPVEAVIEYTNDFEDASRNGEFSGNGFSIRLETGFDNAAIHSEHPHTDGEDFIYTLVQPIRIKGQQFLRYNDVAVIEPGEPGTVFGDNQFWDYVIVEASTDGENWSQLLDGYDARTNEGWLNAYDQGSSGRSSLYMAHQIDLSEFFNKDDIILIRFRLFADAAVNAWGWAIDDVNVILDNTSPTIDIAATENKVYPSPTSGLINIDIDQSMELKVVNVYDLNGKRVLTDDISGQINHQIDISNELSGYYIVELTDGVDNVIKRVYKN